MTERVSPSILRVPARRDFHAASLSLSISLSASVKQETNSPTMISPGILEDRNRGLREGSKRVLREIASAR